MDFTDPEQGETTTAKDWQTEDSTATSSPFHAEQNGSESLASSKDEEVDDLLSEGPNSPTPQSSPVPRPQLPFTRRQTPLGTSFTKKDKVRKFF